MLNEHDLNDWDRLNTNKAKDVLKKVYEMEPVSYPEYEILKNFINVVEDIQKRNKKQVAVLLKEPEAWKDNLLKMFKKEDNV